jgi:hypothetical protein
MTVKTILILILKIIGIILGIVIVYILLGLLILSFRFLPKMMVNRKTFPVYIYTNGVHTDIVMPVKNDLKDWSLMIPFANTKSRKQIINISE